MSEVLDTVPGALELIVSLRPHEFERLRNPFARKSMAPRISLRRVAAMAGLSEAELLQRLAALGAHVEASLAGEIAAGESPQSPAEPPSWMQGVDANRVHEVNVLEIDAVMGDPLPPLVAAVRRMQPGAVIVLRHSWEPQPLYDVWARMGLEWFAQQASANEWHIFLHKPPSHPRPDPASSIAIEVSHLAPGEVVPRILATFAQITPGERLEIAGASPDVERQIHDALETRCTKHYLWRAERTSGHSTVHVSRQAAR